MENTRRRGIKDGYNEKQERILSHRQKEAVTVEDKRVIMDGIFCLLVRSAVMDYRTLKLPEIRLSQCPDVPYYS